MAEVMMLMLAVRVEDGGDEDYYQTIHDVNGNDVGRWRLAVTRED